MLSSELAPPVHPEIVEPVRPRARRGWLVVPEVAVSVGAAALMVLMARGIEVDPLDRIGQVSGLAGLQLRFALIAIVALVAAVITTRMRWGAFAPVVERLAAATAAGLFSGLVAGAVVIALRGTSYGLYAVYGDAGVLVEWAKMLVEQGTMPMSYPPGFLRAMAWHVELTGGKPEYSLKVLQIAVTAMFGPIVYLVWRLLLPPLWALGLGVVPGMVLIEPYKIYANLMLAVLIPLLLVLLRRLRRAGTLSWRAVLLSGGAIGAALGMVFLIYSGWFVWSAPGVIVAALVLFPWRTGWRQGLALVLATVAAFVAVSSEHLFGILEASDSMKDNYFYWDTWVEPTYIAMTRGDMPGAVPGPWPPPGELGGVGLFTILALVGLAAAIAVARRRTAVIMLTCVFAGAWLTRFHLGSQMYAKDAVQLYPRSTAELLYCLLLLNGFALYFGAQRFGHVLRPQSGSLRIGVLATLFLLIACAGSATGDRYMPRTDHSLGMLAMASQMLRQTDGTCSAYSQNLGYGCFAPFDEKYTAALRELAKVGPRPGELPHRTGP